MIERPIPIRQQASIYIQLCNMRQDTATLLLFQLRNSLNTHSSKKSIIEICTATGNSVALAIEKVSSYTLLSTQDDDINEILLTVNTRQPCFDNCEILTVHTEQTHPQTRNTAKRGSVATTFEKFLSQRLKQNADTVLFLSLTRKLKLVSFTAMSHFSALLKG